MNARIVDPTPAYLAEAAHRLSQGEVVGMPTETVYGLAGHAFLPEALARIFATKERPTFDPLIVHVARSLNSLEALEAAGLIEVTRMPPSAREIARRLIAALWPGPLTLVLPKTSYVPDLATSGLSTVAVRMPAHPVAQALLEKTGFPLAAPSANRFGRISPTTAEAVRIELGDRIALILDGGPCEIGVESSVVSFHSDGTPTLLRPGGAPREHLAQIAGHPFATAHASAPPPGARLAQPAPGLLDSHYAPTTPLELLPAPVGAIAPGGLRGAPPPPAKLGLLAFSTASAHDFARALGEAPGAREIAVSILSGSGDLTEAAHNLFAALRELDAAGTARIYAEPCPSVEGLGHAIADRLRRAAAK